MLLSDSVQYLKGIGEKRAELFHKLGIFTVEDLLYHLPHGTALGLFRPDSLTEAELCS